MANAKALGQEKICHAPDTTGRQGAQGAKERTDFAEAGQGGRNLQAMRSLDRIINPVGLHPH